MAQENKARGIPAVEKTFFLPTLEESQQRHVRQYISLEFGNRRDKMEAGIRKLALEVFLSEIIPFVGCVVIAPVDFGELTAENRQVVSFHAGDCGQYLFR